MILRGSCPHFGLSHTSEIHSHSYSSVGFSHPAANISCWDGLCFSFRFSFVLVCLVIIDPVQQGDAQLSHPICQVSAVPVIVSCSWLAILSVVTYLMVWWFALNHAGTTIVHTRLGTSTTKPLCWKQTCYATAMKRHYYMWLQTRHYYYVTTV